MRPTNQGWIVTAALTIVLSACASKTGDSTSTTAPASTTSTASASTTPPEAGSTTQPPTTTTGTPEKTGLVVYFLLDELEEKAGGPFLVPVFREATPTDDVATLTLDALLEGPTDEETAGTPSISSAIPDGTSVLGVDIEDGLFGVDLSSEFDDGGGSLSMFARLAQVVFTLTRLEGIQQVEFFIQGEPVDVFSPEGIELDGPQERSDYYDLLPPIFVDSPTWGEPVTSPIQVSGLSNVFEAASQVMLTDDDGLALFEETVLATCGTGCWGEWDIEIPYRVDREQFGALIVWAFSAEDDSRIHIREYPVLLHRGGG